MNWKRWLIPVSIVPLLALFVFGLTRSPDEVDSALLGKPAPAFALETLRGDILSLSDLTGDTPAVINFWATWCVPCIQEHVVLQQLDSVHPEGELRLVGILYQDRPSNARRWIEERGGEWPILLDPGSETAIEFGISGVPETFFVTRDGRVLHKHLGPVTAPVLEEWIPRLLEGDGVSGQGAPATTGDGGVSGP